MPTFLSTILPKKMSKRTKSPVITDFSDSALTTGLGKSSFERFGDDLMELILSYMSIENKFRFECLSKRIQSLIYNKQYAWKLMGVRDTRPLVTRSSIANYREVNCRDFATVLRKLKFLSELVIDDQILVNTEILHIIADNCHHLRRLSIPWKGQDISDQCIEYFGRKCSGNLKYLTLYYNHKRSEDKIRHLLSFTPELVSLKVKTIHPMLFFQPQTDDSAKLLPKLKEISCDFYNENDLLALQDNYCEGLVKVKANITTLYWDEQEQMPHRMTPEALAKVLSGFGRFPNLKSLELWLDLDSDNSYIVFPKLKLVSANCQQLRQLSLYLSGFQCENNKFLPTLGTFKSLTSLTIMMSHDIPVVATNAGSLADLRHIRDLRQLTISYVHLSDQDFENIDKYLPNLTTLFIWTKQVLTDKTLESLSRLKRLKSLRILCSSEPNELTIGDSGVDHILRNCLHIESLQLFGFPVKPFNISHKSIEAFKAIANQRPKVEHYFSFRGRAVEEYNQVLQSVPNNLKLGLNYIRSN